jgi:glyoxylase-like metal-dependent hydrolase (beta-lactamase superfamily II)
MYEVIQVGKNTFYIESPAKMGIYKLNESEICLIDSGNDKDAGKKVEKILAERGWTLKFILNTHSNADHVGGNALLQQRLGAPAYTSGIEACFNRYPILEPSFLYGGYPCKELRNKFLMAQPSEAQELSMAHLPEGMETIPLGGHYFGMIGFKTPDGVWFLADCMMGENIIQKYHASFIYDVAVYLATLDKVEQLEGNWFIPAHAPACEDIHPLAAVNRSKVLEIIDFIKTLCQQPTAAEEVIKSVFDEYQLNMDWDQYVLVGSTVRSYLTYLLDKHELKAAFKDNRLVWSAV